MRYLFQYYMFRFKKLSSSITKIKTEIATAGKKIKKRKKYIGTRTNFHFFLLYEISVIDEIIRN